MYICKNVNISKVLYKNRFVRFFVFLNKNLYICNDNFLNVWQKFQIIVKQQKTLIA